MFRQKGAVVGARRIVPDGERRAGRALELAVHQSHDRERIFVHAAPDVEPMLFDAIVDGSVAPARPLAAEAPPQLIDRDIEIRSLLGVDESPRRREPATPAAEDHDLPFRCLRVARRCRRLNHCALRFPGAHIMPDHSWSRPESKGSAIPETLREKSGASNSMRRREWTLVRQLSLNDTPI